MHALEVLGRVLVLLGDLLLREGGRLVVWWGVLTLLGAATYPLVFPLCRRLGDRGWGVARATGPFLGAYGAWLLSSLKLLPFASACWVSAAVLVGLGVWRGRGMRDELLRTLRRRRVLFLTEEGVLLFAGGAWALLRSFRPDILDLEKFMDFGFVNAALKAVSMPPVDMWQAGSGINYYHFRHVTAAFVTRLSGIAPERAYNLMLATLCALACMVPLALVYSLVRRLRGQNFRNALVAGFLAASLVALGGNLHGFLYGYALPLAKQAGLYSGEVKAYWYPDATRFIGYFPPTNDKTIHEFPVYSFVVSDLHGHVLAIPLVLALVSLAWCLVPRFRRPLSRTWRDLLPRGWPELLPGLLLGILFMTNAWDYPIYWGLLCWTAFLLPLRNLSGKELAARFVAAARWGLLALGVSQIVLLPFTLHFSSIAKGIGVAKDHTPLWQLGVLWGGPALWALVLGGFLFLEGRRRRREGIPTRLSEPDRFGLLLFAYGAFLVLVPELVYLRDIYENGYARANTMFKFTYQAFILLALGSAYAAGRVLSSLERPLVRIPGLMAGALLLAMPLFYPPLAVSGGYAPPARGDYRGLDGLAFLKAKDAGDYAAALWLRDREPRQVAILEAYGDSYSDHGRISMATGLPTVQGWYVHEWLWRGDPQVPRDREGEVRRVYESPGSPEARKVLDRYGIRYIVVGEIERKKFPTLDEAGLEALGKQVFSSGKTRIIQVEGR